MWCRSTGRLCLRSPGRDARTLNLQRRTKARDIASHRQSEKHVGRFWCFLPINKHQRRSGRHRWQASSHRRLGTFAKSGRLSGRHREQARSHRGLSTPAKSGRLSGRLRRNAARSKLPQKSKDRSAYTLRSSPLNRQSVSSPAAFDLPAPSGGRVEVLRSGQPGMDAGLAAPGHGWPMAAGPRSRTGAREHRALARGRTLGASVFLLTFFRRL
jgi:hypothetical protein